jgi:uncharacterized MnhB-related membrane protein
MLRQRRLLIGLVVASACSALITFVVVLSDAPVVWLFLGPALVGSAEIVVLHLVDRRRGRRERARTASRPVPWAS